MTRSRARLRHVVGEAVRDLTARWILSVLVAVLSCACGASTLVLTSRDTSHIHATWDEHVQSGRFVLSLTGPRGAGVDAATCAVVGSWTGVRAAGGRISTEPVRLVSAPGARYELDQVTSGYLQVLWPGTAAPLAGQVLVGPYLAASAGVSTGHSLAWVDSSGSRGRAEVASVPSTGTAREPVADRHILAVAPAVGRVDRCLVDVDPSHRDAVLAALVTWSSSTASAPLPLADFTRAADPESQLAGRASGWWWAIAAGVVLSAILAVWSTRRADFALHRLLGADTGTIALLLAVDTVVLVLTPLLVGIAGAALVVAPELAHEVVRDLTLLDCARLLVSIATFPVAGLLVVGRGSVFRALKER